MSSEQEVITLREQLTHLFADNTQLHARIHELLVLVAELRGTVEAQQDRIAKLVKVHFGRASERVEGPTLFDEVTGDAAPPPATPGVPNPRCWFAGGMVMVGAGTRRTCPADGKRST